MSNSTRKLSNELEFQGQVVSWLNAYKGLLWSWRDQMSLSRAVSPVTVLLMVTTTGAFEFRYPETDKFYATTVRIMIEKEFAAGMALLESKAKSLNMHVRESDVGRLQLLLRNKSYLYAECSDHTIRAMADNKKGDSKTYYAACVGEGLKMADQADRGAWKEIDPYYQSMYQQGCLRASQRVADTFEFLIDRNGKVEEQRGLGGFGLYDSGKSATDFYALRDCMKDPVGTIYSR